MVMNDYDLDKKLDHLASLQKERIRLKTLSTTISDWQVTDEDKTPCFIQVKQNQSVNFNFQLPVDAANAAIYKSMFLQVVQKQLHEVHQKIYAELGGGL